MQPTFPQQASAAVAAILRTTEDLNRSNAELASAITRRDATWRPWLACVAGCVFGLTLCALVARAL